MSHQINYSDSLVLIPNGYTNTGSYNFTISGNTNISNAYNNSNNTSSSARLQLASSSNSTRKSEIYIELDKSGLSDIPSGATINSVTCYIRYYVSSTSYVSAFAAQLYSNTTAKGSSITNRPTSSTRSQITAGSWTRSELNNIRLYLTATHSRSSTAAYIYLYGVDVTIQYTANGTAYYVTVSLDADSIESIDPSTTQEKLQGEDYELTIYADSIDNVEFYDNNVDIKNQLVRHNAVNSGNSSAVLGEYSLVSGSFNGSGATFFQGIVGKGENASTTTSNYYSGGSGTIAVFTYKLQFANIPSNATITRLYVNVNGHAESTSNSNEYMCAQIYVGSTSISNELNFKSIGTSNSTQTIEATTLPTVSQLSDLKLQCRLGYYGGAINGATCYIEYTIPVTSQYYWTYSISNISDDHAISITEDSGTKYLVSVTNYNTEVTNLSFTQRMVTEGNSVTLSFTTSMLEGVILTDNQIDVTNSISSSGNQRSYTITNVTATHAIIIQEKAWHEVVCESLYGSASISTNKSKVYTGGSFTVTVNVSNLSDIDIKDNDSALQLTYVSNGVYTATISNVTEDHEIIVNEANAYQITATSNTSNATISPSGISSARQGTSKTFTLTFDLPITSIILKDNGVDVTSSIESVVGDVSSNSDTFIPSQFDSTNSTYDSIYTGSISDGLTAHTDTNRICVYSNTGANAESYLYYKFDCSSIPANATITSVTCIASAAVYQGSTYFTTYELQLCNGTTPKGTTTTVTGSGSTSANHNISGGSWTRNELNNIAIRYKVVRGTSNTTDQASFSFWGATLTVAYTTPGSHYEYTLSSISADHTINLFEIYIPEEEDPEIIYHSVTISSINATTSPSNGTVRVEEGDDLTITITPSEQEITLVTDNGVDITSQLNGSMPTYNVTTTASGASYGFTLNSNTGFYVSNNTGVDKSASVCRIDFNLPVACLVTITFINYAEATYDFGVFGNIDQTLSNNYYSAGSGGATITDSNYKLACNTSQYNTASEQTINYEIPSGQHYIYIKYSKDDGTSSNNDTLQWKITDIQPLETLEYTYTLTNIEEDHSILLIFGEVVYYTTTAIIDDYAKLNPNGTFVSLPGEQYSLIVIPDGRNYEVTMTDNNRDVTSKLELLDTEDVYYYVYTIKSVTYNHNIVVTCTEIAGTPLYIKTNDSFVNVIQIWKRSNIGWVSVTVEELTDESLMFFNSSN